MYAVLLYCNGDREQYVEDVAQSVDDYFLYRIVRENTCGISLEDVVDVLPVAVKNGIYKVIKDKGL